MSAIGVNVAASILVALVVVLGLAQALPVLPSGDGPADFVVQPNTPENSELYGRGGFDRWPLSLQHNLVFRLSCYK